MYGCPSLFLSFFSSFVVSFVSSLLIYVCVFGGVSVCMYPVMLSFSSFVISGFLVCFRYGFRVCMFMAAVRWLFLYVVLFRPSFFLSFVIYLVIPCCIYLVRSLCISVFPYVRIPFRM